MKKIVVFSIVVIITLLLISSAKVPEHNEQGYKIKVIKDTIDGKNIEEKIIFVSPDGEIIKSMKKYRYYISVKKEKEIYQTSYKHIESFTEDSNRILMWEKETELNYDPQEFKGAHADKYEYKVMVINEEGEEIFKKSVLGYNDKLMGNANLKSLISKDGETVCIFYMDSTKTYHIEIYSINGEKKTETKTEKLFANKLELSPDGSIFGGTIYEEGKHLYFLNTETGEVKICKAEGEGWGVSVILSKGKSLIPNKILFILRKGKLTPEYKYESKYLYFNEIPSDLSELFGE